MWSAISGAGWSRSRRAPSGRVVVLDRGVDLRDVKLWELELFGDDAVATASPSGSVALRLQIDRDNATLELDLANDATVVGVRQA